MKAQSFHHERKLFLFSLTARHLNTFTSWEYLGTKERSISFSAILNPHPRPLLGTALSLPKTL